MNIQESIQLLTNALNLANTKGVFNLQDAVNIAQAINDITNTLDRNNLEISNLRKDLQSMPKEQIKSLIEE